MKLILPIVNGFPARPGSLGGGKRMPWKRELLLSRKCLIYRKTLPDDVLLLNLSLGRSGQERSWWVFSVVCEWVDPCNVQRATHWPVGWPLANNEGYNRPAILLLLSSLLKIGFSPRLLPNLTMSQRPHIFLRMILWHQLFLKNLGANTAYSSPASGASFQTNSPPHQPQLCFLSWLNSLRPSKINRSIKLFFRTCRVMTDGAGTRQNYVTCLITAINPSLKNLLKKHTLPHWIGSEIKIISPWQDWFRNSFRLLGPYPITFSQLAYPFNSTQYLFHLV